MLKPSPARRARTRHRPPRDKSTRSPRRSRGQPAASPAPPGTPPGRGRRHGRLHRFGRCGNFDGRFYGCCQGEHARHALPCPIRVSASFRSAQRSAGSATCSSIRYVMPTTSRAMRRAVHLTSDASPASPRYPPASDQHSHDQRGTEEGQDPTDDRERVTAHHAPKVASVASPRERRAGPARAVVTTT